MEKCLQYSGQLEKIYRLIGKDKIHFAGDLDVKQMMEEAKLFYVPRKYDEAQHISFVQHQQSCFSPITSSTRACKRAIVIRSSGDPPGNYLWGLRYASLP